MRYRSRRYALDTPIPYIRHLEHHSLTPRLRGQSATYCPCHALYLRARCTHVGQMWGCSSPLTSCPLGILHPCRFGGDVVKCLYSREVPLHLSCGSPGKTIQMWGNVGVRRSLSSLPAFTIPLFGHQKENRRHVIKCNHFRARWPGFTLNIARHSPLFPAQRSTNVIQNWLRNAPLASKKHHPRSHVTILPEPLPSTVYRPNLNPFARFVHSNE